MCRLQSTSVKCWYSLCIWMQSVIGPLHSRWGPFWPVCCVCLFTCQVSRAHDGFLVPHSTFTQCQRVSPHFTAKCFRGLNPSSWPLHASISQLHRLALYQCHTCQFRLAIVSLLSFMLHWLLIVCCWITRLVLCIFVWTVPLKQTKRRIQSPCTVITLCHYKLVTFFNTWNIF